MRIPQATIDYLIDFLLERENHGLVVYSKDQSEWSNHRIVIVPSGFFEKPHLTDKPSATIDGVPVLFGTDKIERQGQQTILHADLIASAYYLLSRYDEYMQSEDRDSHGRFRADKSFLGRNNLLREPLIDQYTHLIYRLLEEEKPKRESRIYLTHDVDTITHYRRARGFVGGICRSLIGSGEKVSTIARALTDIENDPAYTFPFLVETDSKIEKAEQIYFIKTIKTRAKFDRPYYSLESNDYQRLIETTTGSAIGLHTAYSTFDDATTLSAQNKEIKARLHRAHYLRILPPEKMGLYAETGITDDFTLGYAETTGFRLGTTRACRCINPETGELLPITLHPLTVMDGTLSERHYMALTLEQAKKECKRLIDTTLKYQGDITLLWHNTSINQNSYHQELYEFVTDYIKQRCE